MPAQWDFINWFSGPAPAGSSYVYHMQREDGRLVIGANAAPGSQLDDALSLDQMLPAHEQPREDLAALPD